MFNFEFYRKNKNAIINSLCLILCGLFLYIDFIARLGYAAGTPYIIVVMLSAMLDTKRIILFYAGLSTILVVTGFYISPLSDLYTIPIINRIISILVLWIIAFFCILYINAKEVLKIAEMSTSLVFNSAPNALIMVNDKGNIELVNQMLCDMFGYNMDELVGQNLEILVPSKLRLTHKNYREGYIKKPEKRAMAERDFLYALSKNGLKFPVEIALNPIKLDQSSKVIASVIDVTERNRQTKELQDFTYQLEKSNESLEQFAHIASHDLQEPLRMVSSYTQLLADRYQGKLDADANEFINYAVDGAKRMQALIQDLLKFSSLTNKSEKNEQVDANELYDNTLNNLAITINESHAIITKDKLPLVYGDRSQLSQVFQNLIGNAVKYHNSENINRIHVSAEQINNTWRFCIKDCGIGIKPEYYEKIFLIFKRLHTKSEYSGTGVGLALCKRIIDTHGGEIWVESEFDQGSRFYFTLPIKE